MILPPATSPRVFSTGALAAMLTLAACNRTPPPPPPPDSPSPLVQTAQPSEATAYPAIELGEAPRLPDSAQ